MSEPTDTDKIEAAGLHLFTEWDDLPPGIRNGARNLLGCLMACGRRIATAEQVVERLTRELDETNVAAGDYANRLDRAFEHLTRERDEARSEVAELQLTGDRAELRSLLDQCGLDFERMRERALAAERKRDEARADANRWKSDAAGLGRDVETEKFKALKEIRAARDSEEEAWRRYYREQSRSQAAIARAWEALDRADQQACLELPDMCEVWQAIGEARRALARDTDTGGDNERS